MACSFSDTGLRAVITPIFPRLFFFAMVASALIIATTSAMISKYESFNVHLQAIETENYSEPFLTFPKIRWQIHNIPPNKTLTFPQLGNNAASVNCAVWQ